MRTCHPYCMDTAPAVGETHGRRRSEVQPVVSERGDRVAALMVAARPGRLPKQAAQRGGGAPRTQFLCNTTQLWRPA